MGKSKGKGSHKAAKGKGNGHGKTGKDHGIPLGNVVLNRGPALVNVVPPPFMVQEEEIFLSVDPSNRVDREGKEKLEKKILRQARFGLNRSGMCQFPDQANIESLPWFVEKKVAFESAVQAMKQEYDASVERHTTKCLGPSSQEWKGWYDGFRKKWMDAEGVDMTWSRKTMNHKPLSFSDIDFRLWKVIWRKSLGIPGEKVKDSITIPQVKELAAKVGVNLSWMLPEQDAGYQPTVNEISLMAWGTVDQQVHGDNPQTVESPNGKIDIVLPDVELSKWYGSLMYVFEDKATDLKHGPALLLEPRKKYSRTGLTRRSVQQKFCCAFNADTLHAGTVNHTPSIRMHMNIDPNSASGIPLRIPGDVFVSPNRAAQGSYLAKRSRMMTAAELSENGNVGEKYYQLTNFYSPDHVSLADWKEKDDGDDDDTDDDEEH